MKKALVISGGGSKGAFAGGVAQYLMKKKGKDYDLFIGTSTGSCNQSDQSGEFRINT